MLLLLSEYLVRYHSVFRVFSYLTLRSILGVLTALSFAFFCGGKLRWRDVGPGLAVVRHEEFEFWFAGFVGDGIAEDEAVGWIPEDHGVEESFRIFVGELELPVLAGIGGVVDAGLVAGAGGHKERFARGEGNDGAEVECFGAGNLSGDPVAAGVCGAEVGAVSAGRPGNVL